MKKFLVAVMFGLMAIAAQAEATFDQVQTLIEQRQYQAAEQGLEVIIKNHPQSAKAFYAMAQAQAGLGNQEKARKALDIATGLNPTLDFAPASSVASLKEAITPQVKKIEAIEESHALRNFILFAMFAGFGVACYFLYSVYQRKQEEEAAVEATANAEREARYARQREEARQAREALDKAEAERQAKAQAAEDALKAHKNYNHERFDPANPDKLKPVAQFKKEQEEAARVLAEAEARRQRLRAEAAEDEARRARMTYSTPSTTVVNNGGSNDLLTGVLLGNMMSGSHHDHTTVIEREVVREAPSRSGSWDNTPTPAPSRSSSWDDDSSSSSSKSSSWDDSSSSSSSRSSSWSSSSDSSSSSSSWDSGSSSSSSSDW